MRKIKLMRWPQFMRSNNGKDVATHDGGGESRLDVIPFNSPSPSPSHSAGVFLYTLEGGLAVYLIMPGGWLGKRPRTWGMPKGGIEPGESSINAAMRELREETGITLAEGSALLPLGHVLEKQIRKEGEVMKKIEGFAHEAASRVSYPRSSIMITDRDGRTFPETADARWFDVADALSEIRPAQEAFLHRLIEHTLQ